MSIALLILPDNGGKLTLNADGAAVGKF